MITGLNIIKKYIKCNNYHSLIPWNHKNTIKSNFHISRSYLSIVPFKLTDIGEGIAEVELIQWFVKVGDKVKSFDRICEVQSDKATVEITSRYDGKIVVIHHQEGQIVKVGSALVDIDTSETTTSSNEAKQFHDQSSIETITTNSVSTIDKQTIHIPRSKPLTTPAVRKIAKELKIDLSTLKGSGPKGRIIKHDLFYVKRNDYDDVPTATIVPKIDSKVDNKIDNKLDNNIDTKIDSKVDDDKDGKIDEKINLNSENHIESKIDNEIKAHDKVVPIRGLQRLMVKSMNEANKIQHLTLGDEVWFDKIYSLRQSLLPLAEKQSIKLTYLSILVKVTSISLLAFPQLNSTVNNDVTAVTYHNNHNIGLAMDSSKGLVVPVIKNVQSKSIFDIAKEISNLQKNAVVGSFTEEQLKGGTFTLSNIGSIGGTYAVPVLVSPQIAIGAFGQLDTVPKYVNKHNTKASTHQIHSGEAVIKPITIMNVSWSADHRVVDGATIAKFSNLWKSYIENPDKLLSELK